MVVTNTSSSMKYKIKFFLMRSSKVMRAGTGNKNIILCGLSRSFFFFWGLWQSFLQWRTWNVQDKLVYYIFWEFREHFDKSRYQSSFAYFAFFHWKWNQYQLTPTKPLEYASYDILLEKQIGFISLHYLEVLYVFKTRIVKSLIGFAAVW